VSVTIQDEPIAEIDTILATLADPTVKVWDARSSEEYLGLRAGSMRNGHIPGAVNLDWVDVMDPARNLRLLPLAVIRDKLRSLGINDDDSIITHCQSHHRSGLTYMVAKLLGHRAKGYHGSWGEWGNNPDVPIESVA
jgi:thiosulfate/3-mercaptopyruvate sulfurtransferase